MVINPLKLPCRYGDMDAHNLLWEGAEASSGNLAARLAVVPMSQVRSWFQNVPPDAQAILFVQVLCHRDIPHGAYHSHRHDPI